MKTIRDFMSFTNMKGQIKNLALLLLLFSFLYCSAYSLLDRMIYYIPYTFIFYFILYVFVVLFGYIHMIILYQFVKRKRDHGEVDLKACKGPMIFVQSCFFFIMCFTSLASYYCMVNKALSFLQYLIVPILILLVLLYIPWQLFATFEVLDGKKKPIHILKSSLGTIKNHYQSVFYSFLFVALIGVIYHGIMDVAFGIPMQFVPTSAVMDVMLKSNPFLTMFEFFGNVMDSVNLVLPVIVSFVYGVIMCVVLCFYYMFMICVYDEDIKL